MVPELHWLRWLQYLQDHVDTLMHCLFQDPRCQVLRRALA